jgi:hypothetical protein
VQDGQHQNSDEGNNSVEGPIVEGGVDGEHA